MRLTRFNPAREMQELHNTVNRLFNDNWLPRLFEEPERAFTGGRWAPPVDVLETSEEVVFRAELPGFEKDEIEITVNDGRLIISGERPFNEEKDTRYHQVERWYGNFYRSFLLPTSVENEKIAASLKNGVLTITLPKKQEAKPRQISVSVS